LGAALTAAYEQSSAFVRANDPDRYFASLFWPEAARPHAHAVLAFGLEIERVRTAVSEPMLGEIRYQWWRDAIETAAPAGNPLAEALLDTIARFNLDTARLLALIEARSFDLYDDPMPSEAALEAYLRDTSSTLFEAIARILVPGRLPPSCVEAAGRAYALTGLLRGLPWQVMKGQLFLPLDLLARFQLPPEHVLAHRNSPALGLVLNALRARVRTHFDAMEKGLAAAGPHAAACLPAFLCPPYLKRMEAPGLNPFETPIEMPRWRRQWVLWRAARRL
jgi:phytoene synthase